MKKQYFFPAVFSVVILSCFAFVGGNYIVLKSDGHPPYNTNAPSEKTCSGPEGTNACHSGGIPDNSGPGTPSIGFSGGSVYVPGQTYTVTPTISHPNRNRFGFQTVSLEDNTNTFAGNISLIDSNLTQKAQPTWGPGQDRVFMMHRLMGSYPTIPNLGQWTYRWTAPLTSVGTISFYACFNAANNNNVNDSGDETYWAKITISPSAVGIGSNKEIVFSVYPNPASEVVHIDIPDSRGKALSIELMNLQGKIVRSILATSEKNILELKGVENSIYFILIRNTSGRLLTAEKIVVDL